MEKYYQRFVIVIMLSLAIAIMVLSVGGDKTMTISPNYYIGNIELKQSEEPLLIQDEIRQRALVLYDESSAESLKYVSNIRIVLKHLRFDADFIEKSRADVVSYGEYDLVLTAFSDWNAMEDPIYRITEYAANGGRLMIGMLPDEVEGQFASVFRQLGIVEYGDYVEFSDISFEKDLIPGIAGCSFEGDGFTDICITAQVEDRAEIYASYKGNQNEIPAIWTFDHQDGRIVFFNGTGISGDFWRGVIAGCITAVYDTYMYPIINASCTFIDDFPSPQYESTSDVVRKEYNRSVKEFYRDIWWPDMQVLAKRYSDVYTGLYITTYNDVVDPSDFYREDYTTQQYFGNSLLKNHNEMGAHGYNHQSLTLEGGTPESFHYKPWASQADMEASVQELADITAEIFPSVTYHTYVPPSNYLSPEGRAAVKAALPELKVISGIYTNEGEEGDVYVQDFEIAEDGIAEFPRVTAGMLNEPFDRFSAIGAVALYGVYSHFIHPDDIFDDERGAHQNWEGLLKSYSEWVDWIHRTYPYLQEVSACQAADLLANSEAAVYLQWDEEEIRGSVEDMKGPVSFYLRTDREPKSVNENCRIEEVRTEGKTFYYVVTVNSANFTIKLVNE